MSSARDTDPSAPRFVEEGDGHAEALRHLGEEIEQAARRSHSAGRGGLLRAARRYRGELEAFREAAGRWSGELERLRESYETTRDREERLGRILSEREAELKTLRSTAAERELDLQREHSAEIRRQREEIASLKEGLKEAESGSDTARREELREIKRLAFERERELRRTQGEKISEVEREADRRARALREQREADNRSLIERHATEKAYREEEIQSLGLRRLTEARVYGERIEELARERAEERTSLEEAVAKLREKHESERARLRERLESLEEALEEQESITVGLLEELGYLHRPEHLPELAESPSPTIDLVVSGKEQDPGDIQETLQELRDIAAPRNLLREGIALFNESEHVNVVGAISKSLGEPEIQAALEIHGGTQTPVITILWTGMGWRRYVSEPRSTAEPQVYLAGQGEDTGRETLPSPNARLDAQGKLSLGVRPL